VCQGISPHSIASSDHSTLPPLKHATLDKDASDPSCAHDHSPSPTNPLDIDPATTSLSALPAHHLIHDNVEPIARLQKERLNQELKRVTSMPSPILLPVHSGSRVHEAGYVSPLPITDHQQQMSSPLPKEEHTGAADTDIILSSPAFAMGPTPKHTMTVPLTTSNLAQHDRIIPPAHTAQPHDSSMTIKTNDIPAYHP
jgi:hypothetical protein